MSKQFLYESWKRALLVQIVKSKYICPVLTARTNKIHMSDESGDFLILT